MASQHIDTDPSTRLGAAFRACVANGTAFRQANREMYLVLNQFGDDSVALQAALGTTTAQEALDARALNGEASREMAGDGATAVDVLLNRMG